MKPIGFIGLGAMGEPMAANLIKAGFPVMVWNRSADKMRPLIAAGATRARTAREVFLTCPTVALMLANGAAMDEVLERGSRAFVDLVAGRTLISMATTDPPIRLGSIRTCAGRAALTSKRRSRGHARRPNSANSSRWQPGTRKRWKRFVQCWRRCAAK